MPLPLKDRVKLDKITRRIQSGQFDANDVDNLLMKLRPYSGRRPVFLEIAHFVAHPEARDKGLAQQSIAQFIDSIRFFREYPGEQRALDLRAPFPAYVHRFLLSQARLSDEQQLKTKYQLSHATLVKKIEANFTIDKPTDTCRVRGNKDGVQFVAALEFISSRIHARAAFSLSEFHGQLKDVLREQTSAFDEVAWSAQTHRVSLAILCLVSNTEFRLDRGACARCELQTEHRFRLLGGHRRLPTGFMSSEPTSFGSLRILGEATIVSTNTLPLTVSFPLIETDLDPHEHCDASLFRQIKALDYFGDADCDGDVEVINFAHDMSLSDEFKLVRTDSIPQ